MLTLGSEIKKARVDQKMKQKDLHEKTKISQKYLSRIENDKADPSWSVVAKIAFALGMSLEKLIEVYGKMSEGWPTGAEMVGRLLPHRQ